MLGLVSPSRQGQGFGTSFNLIKVVLFCGVCYSVVSVFLSQSAGYNDLAEWAVSTAIEGCLGSPMLLNGLI